MRREVNSQQLTLYSLLAKSFRSDSEDFRAKPDCFISWFFTNFKLFVLQSIYKYDWSNNHTCKSLYVNKYSEFTLVVRCLILIYFLKQ